MRKPVEERLWPKIAVSTPDSCWEWTAGRNWQGYGQIAVDRGGSRYKTEFAHRIVLELTVGASPLDKPIALHSCDNPPCCNPAHLSWGTISQNALDMYSRGRQTLLSERRNTAIGERHGNAKLTADQVLEIRNRYLNENISQLKLGEEYGVNQSKISIIVRGKAWKHVSTKVMG